MSVYTLSLIALLAPLGASLVAGFFGKAIGRKMAHRVAISGVGLSTLLSAIVFYKICVLDEPILNVNLYQWLQFADTQLHIGLLIDSLSATMMLVVTFVSLMVHIYTIGYMDHDEDYDHDNPYYQRFFSYISLFTFAMLTLVMSNNFLQLFFGWEAVGLVSYLLIGFYMKRPTAIAANLKAFLVNRVGDFGFLLGIAGVLMFFGTLDYAQFFAALPQGAHQTINIVGGYEWQVVTVIGLLLFVGAMGKSAQMPLHVWLPESMEGPTPISALIHAATMVTAGIYMVARLSPLFELSEVASSSILIIGASTALFMGFLGVVQNDIKRVVAYSTLSQLGYMVAALGVSAYSIGFFHVMTHAFFKALLFLGAGSVIIGMHHKQDIREMGGLKKYMPITWICMLIGSLSLIGTPGFSGFFSKDSIIIAVENTERFGATYAEFALLIGVFFTALYSFRMFFMVFHGKESEYVTAHPPHESPKVVTVPLILLAIPSVFIGGIAVSSWVFGDYFADSLFVAEDHTTLKIMAEQYHGVFAMILHSFVTLPFYFALAGVAAAWYLYLKRPELPEKISIQFNGLYRWMLDAYGFDRFNEWAFVKNTQRIGTFFWSKGDVATIDDTIINGGAAGIARIAQSLRLWQSGYLYHYVFVIIIGLMGLLTWLIFV